MYLDARDDDEKIEAQLYDEQTIRDAGFIDKIHYTEYKNEVIHGLLKFGGLFYSTLGQTLLYAGLKDSLKILRYWGQECEQHAIMYKMYLAKEKAK